MVSDTSGNVGDRGGGRSGVKAGSDLNVGDAAGSPVVGRLRRLEAEATDGPWCVADNGQDIIGLRGANGGAPVAGYGTTAANAELIVEVRNLLPALLDIAEHAEKLVRALDGFVYDDPPTEFEADDLMAALARLEETR